jgi:hypothetical protein
VGLIGTLAGIAGALGGLSIARRRKLPSIFGAMIVSLLITSNSCAADQVVTPNMVGHWEGNGRIIVTWCRQTSLPVTLNVAANGTVTGKIGDANLANGHLKRNRGWVGRKLNFKTDYIITGNLTGPIVAAENIVRSGVKMPLNFSSGNFNGGIHTSGFKFGGKERMILSATFLKLTRIPTQ